MRQTHRVSAKPSVAARLARAPETARFLRRAAPAFIREMSREYHRESEPAARHPHPKEWPDHGLHAAWLGHSTVLLKLNGTTILTDPVFSSRIGLNFGPVTLGIKRLTEVAAPVSEMPPVDLILLSHAHMDHFDLPSLRELEEQGHGSCYGVQNGGPASDPSLQAGSGTAVGRDGQSRRSNRLRVRGQSLGRADAKRRVSRLQRVYGRDARLPHYLRRRYRLYRRVPATEIVPPVRFSRLCRLGLTIHGYAFTAIPSRRGVWQTTPARTAFCPCIIRPSASATN